MESLHTDRLTLRPQTQDDAPFLLALMRDPDWLEHIGDRGVRTEAEARAYVESVTRAMYRDYGVGLLLVQRKADGDPVGICGLLHRDAFEHPDLGFAVARAHRRRGYAREAAAATLHHAEHARRLDRVDAIVSPENDPSIRLLTGLGFAFGRAWVPPSGEAVHLYSRKTP